VTLTRQQIVRRVRHWVRALGLTDWHITVQVGPLKDNSEANCAASPEYCASELGIDPAHVSSEQLDAYLLHELSHLMTWRLLNCAETLAGDNRALQEWVRVESETCQTMVERALCRAHGVPVLRGVDSGSQPSPG
jgi:hypothetical protein